MIRVRMPVVKQCPYRTETDTGELEIITPGDAPELHALAAALTSLAAEAVTHEDYTRRVHALAGRAALVITRWRTGPWDAECAEGDLTLAGRLPGWGCQVPP